MTSFAIVRTIESLAWCAATAGLILSSPWILTIKKIRFWWGATFFFKILPLCKCFFFLICWPEFQIRAPLMTDAIYSKLGPTRLCDGFRVELMIFLKYFCLQKFCFPEFCFHLIYFLQPNDLVSPIKDSISFLVDENEARRFVQFLSNVCYDFQYICLK